MRAMERLLGLPPNRNLVLQLQVLAGKLLEHAVDGSRQRIELVRSSAHFQTARGAAFDNGRRSAADFMNLEKQRTSNQPPNESAQQQGDSRRTGNSKPEQVHQRLEARAFAAHQQMVATRQLYMRHNDSLRRATRVERKPIGSRPARHLYRPGGQVA